MAQVQRSSVLALLVVVVTLSVSQVADAAGLKYGYYSGSCPNVEKIIFGEIKRAFRRDRTVAAGILRLNFHDCFVRGCDASVLLAGNDTERASFVNVNLHGFDVIDEIKTEVEKVCPNTVSCADILAFAARDTVVVTGGKGWKVQGGRLDGKVSNSDEVVLNLPPATFHAQDLINNFAAKGLTTEQMVVLSGSHTLGLTHCVHLRDRIFAVIDPTVPKSLLKQLQKVCPTNTTNTALVIDRTSEFRFDTAYYQNIKRGFGLMTSDQTLYASASTRPIVVKNLNRNTFFREFGEAMIAMQAVEVKLDPSEGEIRKSCQVVN